MPRLVECPKCGRMCLPFAIRDGRCKADIEDEKRASAPQPEVTWEDVRGQRKVLLEKCDWTQTSDSPLNEVDKAAWASYRQALRDLTTLYAETGPATVVWPTPPQ